MKLIKKLLPVSVFGIAEFQSYLSDMAAKGFMFRKTGRFYATYEKAEPQKVSYRLEPVDQEEIASKERKIAYYKEFGWEWENELKKEKREYYKEFGWEYVATVYPFNVFSSTREEPTEMYTDPVTQGHIYEYLRKKTKNEAIVCAVFSILVLLGICNLPLTFYVGRTMALTTAILLVMHGVAVTYETFRNNTRIKTLTSSLQSGIPVTQRKEYKKSYSHLLVPLIPLLMLYANFLNLINIPNPVDIASFEGTIPTILIAGIENDVDIFYSSITHVKTELAYDVYNVTEAGEIAGRTWEGTTEPYAPSLKSRYYELRFPLLTDTLFDGLVENALDYDKQKAFSYNELTDTRFNRAVTVETETTQILLAYAKDSVIQVTYEGEEDLFLHIEDIYTAIQSESEGIL